MPSPQVFQFSPVAVVHSCYRTKFGIPRQSGLIREAIGEVELLPPYNQPNAVRGLEEFSHIWLLFVFDPNKLGIEKFRQCLQMMWPALERLVERLK